MKIDEIKKNLLDNHANIIFDIIKTYFTDKIRDQIMCYFRIYFLFYILVNYVYLYNDNLTNIANIKEVFFFFFDNTYKNNNLNYEKIRKNLEKHFVDLHKIFFIDKNMYFHVYFNNLIKYCLPVPYDYVEYSPFLTYRNKNTFYKKSNIDFLDNITELDTAKQQSYVKKKNVDIRNDEIDLHIPIKYFTHTIFDNKFSFIIAQKNIIYICNKVIKIKDTFELEVVYKRNTEIDIEKYKEGVSFELLMPLWEKYKKTESIELNKIVYISVLKKLTKEDLFNCFGKLNFPKEKYKYLFHNTGLEDNILIDKPTFFYFIPSSSSEIYKMSNRKCFLMKVKEDIFDILDLTTSIMTNNSFMKFLINRDMKIKKWISYDNLQVMDYYKNKEIPTKFDKNYKCITLQNTPFKDFIKLRPYCDIAETIFYSGRRKLQEILFKTRKYDLSKIYYYHFMKELYKKYDLLPNQIYHPQNIIYKETRDYEKYILAKLNINGFFFTDFVDAFDKGGELLLIKPYKFLELDKLSDKPCKDKSAFLHT